MPTYVVTEVLLPSDASRALSSRARGRPGQRTVADGHIAQTRPAAPSPDQRKPVRPSLGQAGRSRPKPAEANAWCRQEPGGSPSRPAPAGQGGNNCATFPLPLDRTGAVSGNVSVFVRRFYVSLFFFSYRELFLDSIQISPSRSFC